MKQIYVRLCFVIFFALAFVGFMPNSVNADVNDFSFSSFDVDYYLSKDNEGRSTMKVVERLTAEFANKNQNKGIERAIPRKYDGHPVSFELESLTRNGQPEPIYEQSKESNFIVIATGTEEYVNGTQEYIFTYTLRDVVKSFDDHQELYWDTNGTGWSQKFDTLTARVHLDGSISQSFTGAVSCYKGREGSNADCPSVTNENIISFSSEGTLYPYENLTFNLSFVSGTFAEYSLTFLDIVPYLLLGASVVLTITALIIKIRYGRGYPGRGTIIAEYLPPKNTSVLLSAEIANKVPTSSTAQIIDLAVRHKIRIIESKEKFLFTTTTKYTLELINIDNLNAEELSFVNIMFGGMNVGDRYTFNKSDQSKGVLLNKLNKSIREQTEREGYRLVQKNIKIIQAFVIVSAVLITIMAGVMFIDNDNDLGVLFFIPTLIAIVILISVFRLFNIRPLTEKGRELQDYLKGLAVYIKLAEADRLRVLQSPKGAEKTAIDTNDTSQLVILYERVLPYAVLFGHEKEWFKQLGNYYESNQTTPGWYSGVGAFNAASFASSVGGFSSYASSSSFSSSSGAGGGGSSGGGGGGGGGGGR